MTYEPIHSAEAQSVGVTEKISLLFLGHHFEVRINVHCSLISKSSP